MYRFINRAAFFIAFITCIAACRSSNKWLPKTPHETVVVLQPLSLADTGLLPALKDSIASYYPVTVRIARPAELPAFAYYQPRNRYKADSLLVFLQRIKPAAARLIAGITQQDISARKGAVDDYGLMGDGYCPGNACVVSIYRLNRSNPSQTLFKQRLLKTVIHELGHNFGLPHCPNPQCIMADAKGKLSQDNETALCTACKKKLHIK